MKNGIKKVKKSQNGLPAWALSSRRLNQLVLAVATPAPDALGNPCFSPIVATPRSVQSGRRDDAANAET